MTGDVSCSSHALLRDEYGENFTSSLSTLKHIILEFVFLLSKGITNFDIFIEEVIVQLTFKIITDRGK